MTEKLHGLLHKDLEALGPEVDLGWTADTSVLVQGEESFRVDVVTFPFE